MAGTGQPRGGSVWWAGLLTISASVVATLVVRALALALFDISPEFEPLATAGRTVILTVIFVFLAVLVFAAVRRFAARPARLFRNIAVVALLLSLVPVLTDGGSAAFPGASGVAVAVLIVQHVVAATVVVWMLTMRRPSEATT